MSFCEPSSFQSTWPAYEKRPKTEIKELLSAIPLHNLAIQWDIAAEICFILENPELAKAIPMEALVASIARVSEGIPQETELGLHLCYGDPGHKHVVEPKDTTLMVDLTHALVAASNIRLRSPVPRDRDDVAYFEPLKR